MENRVVDTLSRLRDRRAPEPLQRSQSLREQLAAAEDWGCFGPTSVMWQLHREAVIGLGLGRALLMQLAHPWVAQAVADHSDFRARPTDRLLATVSAAELLIFGSRAQADVAAATIRTVHSRIRGTLSEDTGRWRKGTSYSAENPDALLWVLVTLVDTVLLLYEATFGRLPDDVVRSYLADASRLGSMLGVIPEEVPRDRTELVRYIEAAIADGTVAVGRIARRLARSLERQPLPLQHGIFLWPYRTLSAATARTIMPEPLRRQYEPVLDGRYVRLYRLAGRLGGAMVRRLPPEWRMDPIAAPVLKRADLLGERRYPPFFP